ncbi:carbon-nitrogen hydrolase family protein [Flavisphingomonas formosensis]|uniref:carbon-nitrogen hydrolase family protein n=1 Tax=Flavisphingomonas formosensis TaxID=861534 RepID=UPI0012FB5D9C|nr:carbon-nitrogen hydrolase family protein [Sphingomonas formosensis]
MTIIATVAFEGSYDVEISTRRHLSCMDEAAGKGAELVVFPETSLQGYPPDVDKVYPERIRNAFRSAEPVPGGPHVRQIVEHARKLGIYVVFGLHETGNSPGVIYNTAVLTGPEGFVGKYRKVHVGITEQLTWRKGDDWPVFETRIGRIGMLICYDKMWPESTRELTLRGADILVMPTAWPMMVNEKDPETNIMVDLYRMFDRIRAAENGRWFISSNFGGELGGAQFVGLSQIVDPWGRVVATTGTVDKGMAVADVDIHGGIEDVQTFQGARLIRDRRPDTYRASSGEIPAAIDG